MKKILIGVLSLGLVIAGGVTAVFAQSSSNTPMSEVNIEQMENMNDMHQMMHGEKGPINYGQMKKVAEQVHPEWNKEQIKEMYNSMHGTNGAEPSTHFKRMNEN